MPRAPVDSESEASENSHHQEMLANLQRMADPHRVQKFIAKQSPEVRKRIRALQGQQKCVDEHYAEMQKEKAQLRAQFTEKMKPLIAKRAALVKGESVPTEEIVKAGLAFMAKKAEDSDDEDAADEEKPDVDTSAAAEADAKKGVPDFWLTVMQNCADIAESLEEHDTPLLKSLVDVECEELSPAGDHFILKFHFAPNDYFTNAVLTKEYQFKPCEKPEQEDEHEIIKLQGCAIDWKPGKDVTTKIEKKRQQKKGQKQTTRYVTRSVSQESFFRFFSPPSLTEDEDEDADSEEDTEERVEEDAQMGVTFRDQLIPRAVEYYCNEVDDDDDDDEEEEEDEEDEEEDDDEAPQKKAKNKPGGKGGEKQECKQQ
eukprot:TRINITY_DN1924_c0_g5_i1.p1 TRINITY_DN1924_c0_g5~~TRINITY_DN1924_c0_g5_i1.p1  ORF type:complete len:398 (+),score=231.52 TRINITY_DN1924_c0_g5_i1:83-1195(+)